MALDLTAFAALLKTYYTPEQIVRLVYQKHPFLGIIQKQKMTTGEVFRLPLIYGSTANSTADFSTAIAGTVSVPSVAFNITTSDLFGHAAVNQKLIELSGTDKISFARAVTTAVNGAMDDMANVFSRAMYGDGSGTIGQIATIDTGADKITFVERSSVRQLQPGSLIIGDDLSTMASPHSDVLTVLTVDRDEGSVTYSGTDSSFANGHYIARKGMAALGHKGLAAWLPAGASRASALAASFFGVTRSTDGTRLGGIAYDASSMSIEDALVGACHRSIEEGGTPDLILMNSADFLSLIKTLQGKFADGNIQGQVGNATVSYKGVTFATPAGMVTVIVDPDCPKGHAYVLEIGTWSLLHAGNSPICNPWDADGLTSMRSTTANEINLQFWSFAQLGCQAPGRNVHVFSLS